jgi:hypothetical protein
MFRLLTTFTGLKLSNVDIRKNDEKNDDQNDENTEETSAEDQVNVALLRICVKRGIAIVVPSIHRGYYTAARR